MKYVMNKHEQEQMRRSIPVYFHFNFISIPQVGREMHACEEMTPIPVTIKSLGECNKDERESEVATESLQQTLTFTIARLCL